MSEKTFGYPKSYGLYNSKNETENCGIGFVANIKKSCSHALTLDALEMLSRMDHRGGCGFEKNTGDGAGILTNIPHSFFIKEIQRLFNVRVEEGRYSIGNIFLPQDEAQRSKCMQIFESLVKLEGQEFVAWRDVPVSADKANIGLAAKEAQPYIKQIIIKAAADISQDDFDRKLFVIRKCISRKIRKDNSISQNLLFYVCSLSTRIIIYKGMLIGSQILDFYPDLANPEYKVYLAMVHSRFSTNTFPSWDRAQPCRFMSHNGEINTFQGNANWMRAREGMLENGLLKDDVKKILPIMEDEVSDSGGFDNVLEFLMMSGRNLHEALLMMVPEAWQNDLEISEDKRAFYQYFSNIIEPWDGPSSITFSDGRYIGSLLDRNGLRPSRFYHTFDDRIIMSSEVGVIDVEPENIKAKGRLQPGKIFLIDFEKGEIIDDNTIKSELIAKNPYKKWVEEEQIYLKDLRQKNVIAPRIDKDCLISYLKTFGYSVETMQFILLPLIKQERDPLGSMGNDTALAFLSDQSRIVYDYFKQLFAQVTNPSIDSIREGVIMSLMCSIGPEGSLLKNSAKNAKRLILEQPILSNEDLLSIKNTNYRGFKAKSIDITYEVGKGHKISSIIDDICHQALQAITDGYSFIILSDKNISATRAPVSALLASSAVHRSLVSLYKRSKIAIVLETGEAREVHHFCVLMGYGVDAINPYLAFEALWQAKQDNLIDLENNEVIIDTYRKSVNKGILKVMAKMGISTLASYKGAQIFEAVGLNEEVINKCFFETASRIGGVGFDILQKEVEKLHYEAYKSDVLYNMGQYHWRSGGEKHMWEPQTIYFLQQAAKSNDKQAYWDFAKRANEEGAKKCTLRGLMSFKKGNSIDITEVEEAKDIVKRFSTGAMSFGSISAESHETLAIAMNRIGGKSNTGEGGEDSARWQPDENGDSRRSAIKQIASGRFGVTIDYLSNADELQIKISQGAKPGEGGELPGHKVDKGIARTRYSTEGVGLISPPPHHDIYSIEDLAQLIFDLNRSNYDARISVKLVSELGVGTIAAGVTKSKADHIVISGHDGGTGASALTSIKHAGLPWELGIAETHQTLVMNNLRSRVAIQTDGQLKTGRDVAIAILLGAEEFGFSTAPLITLGCIMMRKCHLNTCPVGIATQNKELRKKFKGKPEHVVNYLFMVAEELRLIMADLGFKSVNEMIGRVDMLEVDKAINHWKASNVDLKSILTMAKKPQKDAGTYQSIKQDHNLDKQLDNKFLKKIDEVVDKGINLNIQCKINNTDRAVGARMSSYLVKKIGKNNLRDDAINIKFNGSAGQSFGAFLANGINLEIEGDANDYVGKGLSGGRIVIYPQKQAAFSANEAVIAGNACGYGATSGQMYLSGIVAERFCIRNSGLIAVVEGVGDHGCEYMTGGRAVILGEVGRNFGAGMSGGIAYIYDIENKLNIRANKAMIDLDPMDEESKQELFGLINNHLKYTNSKIAKEILDDWDNQIKFFVKVMPKDLKNILLKNKNISKCAS